MDCVLDYDIYESIKNSAYVSPEEKLGRPLVAVNAGFDTDHDGLELHRPLVTYGNFCFISAPPKTMKTFYTTLISAAYLGNVDHCGGVLGCVDKKGAVVHFDTEQGKYHCARVQSRISYMCPSSHNDFVMYSLRPVDVKTRVSFIEMFLEENKDNVGLVIIDGIADLLMDNNNIEQSNHVVQKLMTWTHAYNVAIVTVIHSNWGSTKATGHIGSFLEKKAETMIRLQRESPMPDGSAMIKAVCANSRNRPFRDHYFYVKNGIPEILRDESNSIEDIF